MALTTSKGCRIALCIVEITWYWKLSVGLKNPVHNCKLITESARMYLFGPEFIANNDPRMKNKDKLMVLSDLR